MKESVSSTLPQAKMESEKQQTFRSAYWTECTLSVAEEPGVNVDEKNVVFKPLRTSYE